MVFRNISGSKCQLPIVWRAGVWIDWVKDSTWEAHVRIAISDFLLHINVKYTMAAGVSFKECYFNVCLLYCCTGVCKCFSSPSLVALDSAQNAFLV